MNHALAVAAAGYPVFPCNPADKTPLVGSWPTVASTDPTVVANWWAQWPTALVGVVTGTRSGLHVLDLDVKNGKNGPDALHQLGLTSPATRWHQTASGGLHLLYRANGHNKTDSDVLASGVDRRGDGGYIIWWPAHGGASGGEVYAEPPEWMTADAARGSEGPALPPLGLTDEQVDALMAMLPEGQMASRSEWIKVGLALHHEFNGDAAGLQTWDSWSSRWPKYEGMAACAKEWRTFGRGRRSQVTLRSFVPMGWLRQQGLPDPQDAFSAPAAEQHGNLRPEVSRVQGTTIVVPLIPLEEPALPQAMRDARDGTATTRPLTEMGNALRMYDRYGNDLRYVTDTKGWLAWTGASWVWDIDGAIPLNLAQGLSRYIYAEGAANIHESDLFAKWARKTHEIRVGKASVNLLSTMQVLRVTSNCVDTDIMMLGLDKARQVADLRTGQVRPAERGDMITRSAGASGVGDPKSCVRWLAFLNQVFGGDAHLIDWVRRWCGYTLTGSVKEHMFVFAHGVGRNGKGTFTEMLRYILGEYATPVAIETLTDARRSAGAASPDVAALLAVRLAFCNETNDEQAIAEGLLKTLTGGDYISARQPYGRVFQFLPQFKIWVNGNHKPIIRGGDNGVWSRVRLIPFTRIFATHEQDKNLTTALRSEAEHILAWMIQGCLDWQAHGLDDTPEVISVAVSQYREEMDDMGQWLDECCDVTDPARETVASFLYESFKQWFLANGHKNIITMQKFGRKMSDRGFARHKTNKYFLYRGIGVKL